MSDRPRASGATPRAGTRHRRPLWLWLLVALLLLIALLFALSRCGADTGPVAAPDPRDAGSTAASDPATAGAAGAAPSTPAAPTPVPDTAAATPPAGPGAGTLMVGNVALLPVAEAAGPDGSLSGRAGEAVTATGVTVQSVPADEGFWVGTSDTDRVWVQLLGEGESGYVVRPGDRVEFDGQLVAHDRAFAGDVGVDPNEGADDLTIHGAHVAVRQSDLRVASR